MGIQINGVSNKISSGSKIDFPGSVGVAGTLTYEDVANVDSVGLITARTGINIGPTAGVAGTFFADGSYVTAGVVTATTFVGALTGNVTGNISGSTGTFTGDVDIADKIVHTGDTNTAIRFPAADTITAETGGSERLRITSSGSVGIGTDSPTNNALTLGGTNAALICQNPNSGYGSNQGFYFGNGNGTIGYVWNYENDEIRFATNNTEKLRINASGQLIFDGDSNTHIARPAADTFAFTTGGSESLRIDNEGRLLIGTTTEGHAAGDNLTVADSGNAGITIRSGTSNNGVIYFSDGTSGADEYRGAVQYNHTDNYLRFYTNGAEKLRIDSSGRLLIGTTTEGHGNADELTISFNNTGVSGGDQGRCGMTIRSGDNTSGVTQNGYIYFSDGTSGGNEYKGVVAYSHSDDSMYFSTAGTERLRITSGGQVGLGRDNSGNINTRAVLELAAPFSDVSDNDGSADQGTNNHDAILINVAGVGAASGRNIGSIAWDTGGRRRAAIMAEYQNTDNDYMALSFFTRGNDGDGDFFKSYIINHNGSASLHGSLSQNTSDDRLKKDKVEIENALDKVNSLSSFTHKWNEIAVRAGLEENKTEIGLSAQEVQGLYPSLVDVNNTMIDPDNPTTEYLTIHYEKVVPLLVASIKELTSEINSLKSRLSSLEGS